MAMITVRSITTGLCAMALTIAPACAVKQAPPAAESLKSVLPPNAAVPADWKSSGGSAGTVATDWITTFADKQLEALVLETFTNNLELKAAAARIDVASALVVQTRALLYPQLMALGSVGAVGRDDVKDRSGLVGELSWELDLWGRVRAQAAVATANRDATEADLLYARQSMAALVATLWYQTIANERLRQTAEDAARIYEQYLQLVRTKNQLGQIGQQDVALAGADLDRARQRERSFATTEQQLARGLEVNVGRYPSAELALAPDLPALPGPVPDGLPSELLERRPDLIAAERRLAAAFHSIQVAEAARLPRIALTVGGGKSTSDLLRLANVGTGFWRVGADVFAPLFTAGSLKAQVAQANAEQQAALALYGQAALRAFGEVESSLASEQLLADQQKYLESVLAQDTEALRLGRIRYDAGATDFLHVLQMQARQLITQYDLIAIRNGRLANRVALHLALGGGFVATP
jgi:NodT family efflux transporter outer membrane factor (OMF) lipoprotein